MPRARSMTAAFSRIARSALLLCAGVPLAACGVLFGAEEGNLSCGDEDCTAHASCPAEQCPCNDGSTVSYAFCFVEDGCCAARKATCDAACARFGGFSESSGGSGGSGGSTGGSGGATGSGGSLGFGGSLGSGGSFGSGGSTGSGGSGGSGRFSEGDPCPIFNDVACGCRKDTPSCDEILGCNGATWEFMTSCEGARCFTGSMQNSANCGTPSFYLPYALLEGPCTPGVETYACTPDLGTQLQCDQAGRWIQFDSCAPQGLRCGAVPNGSPGCTSGASFCIGCL
jgi:hypothetical protein